jgi:predicted MPP superfamily phosphohydrolase
MVSRRRFVGGSLAGLAGLAAAASVVDGFLLEPQRAVAEHVEIKLPRLPEAFDGFRIAQLSDIHFGPYMTRPELDRAVNLAKEFKPSLVALTGDFVSHPWRQHNGLEGAKNAEPCADAFADWKSVPILAVLGNHDHWNDADLVGGALAERGIEVMRNKALPIEKDGQRLWIAGVDDVLEGWADLSRTTAGIPANEATILLAHEPDYADLASKAGIDLQLSGHSHGGQVRVPGVGPLVLPNLARKYHTGLNRVGNLQVYTTRGIGVINPPVRLNCPPEVTLITLKKAR